MITIRKTTKDDHTAVPWLCEISLVGTRACAAHGMTAVHATGQNPEHAMSKAFEAIGRSAYLAPAENGDLWVANKCEAP